MAIHNVLSLLSDAFARSVGADHHTHGNDTRARALANTLHEAYSAARAAGLDLHRDDLAEGLRTLVRLAPREQIPDAKRHETLVEMLSVLDGISWAATPSGPRGNPAWRLRQCAAVWRAMVESQDPLDPRGASIRQRWAAEASLLEGAAAEPRVLYIATGPDKSGALIYGRVLADHDFDQDPVVVVHTDGTCATTYGDHSKLPAPWQPLLVHAAAILSAVYERENPKESALHRLKISMPSGVIAGEGVLELHVLPDQPEHVGTAYGRDPIAISDIVVEAALVRTPRHLPSTVIECLREIGEGFSELDAATWADGLTREEWESKVLEALRARLT